MNTIGDIIMSSEKNPDSFNIPSFLVENLPKKLEHLRKLDVTTRLKKLKKDYFGTLKEMEKFTEEDELKEQIEKYNI